jgi:hypothetical protein
MFNEIAALERIVNGAIARGYYVSVNDGDAWPVKMSQYCEEIVSAADSVDEALLVFRNADKVRVGSALVVWGNGPEELIADCSDNALVLELVGLGDS